MKASDIKNKMQAISEAIDRGDANPGKVNRACVKALIALASEVARIQDEIEMLQSSTGYRDSAAIDRLMSEWNKQKARSYRG